MPNKKTILCTWQFKTDLIFDSRVNRNSLETNKSRAFDKKNNKIAICLHGNATFTGKQIFCLTSSFMNDAFRDNVVCHA